MSPHEVSQLLRARRGEFEGSGETLVPGGLSVGHPAAGGARHQVVDGVRELDAEFIPRLDPGPHESEDVLVTELAESCAGVFA